MTYLFLAIPNFCGSTLLHSLLETVPHITPLVSPEEFNGKKDFVEGNICAPGGYVKLNGPHSIEANMEHVYSDPANYNWPWIKSRWEENWGNTNPYATIKMQKTPADIFRIKSMLPHFNDLKWILSVRNPYHYVESIFRKATFQMDPIRQLDQICYHVTRTLEVQRDNIALLGDTAYVMTYEDFIARPEYHRDQMALWLPELKYIDFSSELWIKGQKVKELKNDADDKFKRFIEYYPDIVSRINEFFEPKKEIIEYWGYQLLSPN
jgi:hypothetical protein